MWDACLQELSEADLKNLKRRKLVTLDSWTTFHLSKGPNFALQRKQLATDLTGAMLKECAPAPTELFRPCPHV